MIGSVLTGDIIHSTKLTGEIRSNLVSAIEKYLRQLRSDYGIRYELYRGDSFQCLTKKTGDGLHVALLIKTFIRSLNPSELSYTKKTGITQTKPTILKDWIFDARIAIGVGEVGQAKRKLAISDGMAFFNSGSLLDEIKNTRQHLAITSDDLYREEWEVESLLLDALVRKTTALQCQVLNQKLDYRTETEIANRLNIGQSAVNQRANTAEWRAIEEMVHRFRKVYDGA